MFDSAPGHRNRDLRGWLAAATGVAGAAVAAALSTLACETREAGVAAAEMYPQEAAELHADDLEVIRSGVPMMGIVKSVRDAEGHELWTQTDRVPYRDDSGKVAGIVVMAQDITDRKRDQDALRELNAELEARVRARTVELNLARDDAQHANRAKSAFLATMSHEIRTPMNGVIAMIEVLHQTSLQGHQLEMVGLIRDSAFSLLHIIENILDFSKIEAGKVKVESEPMHLADTVEQVCGMLDHLAATRQVRMTMFIDPAIPHTMLGDDGRVRQVLVNLASNAIKFSGGSEATGRVAVRVVLVEWNAQIATVELIVVDNGIGIDQATLQRLFTPFSQADLSTTRRFGGSGLGLAISSTLVSLMGGKISVHSGPNVGSTFSVQLRFPATDCSGSSIDAAGFAEGLRCRIVGREQPLADDIDAYLTHAKVTVERSPDLASAAVARSAGHWLWLILPGATVPSIAELRALSPNTPDCETRFIVLGWGSRRRPRIEAPDLVVADADSMSRRSLFRILALASGRLQEEDSTPATGLKEPDRHRPASRRACRDA